MLLKKCNAVSRCYSRYSADAAGRCFAADNSSHVADLSEPAAVISCRTPNRLTGCGRWGDRAGFLTTGRHAPVPVKAGLLRMDRL
jgi:hypothetical protein